MIDFSEINAFDGGQRESFEELICILAKREKPESATEFQRVEGSGGDGGVEAIWLLSDGAKVGYQGKFFASLGNSQWGQMDGSVRRALNVHPELKKYVVALPCNLTHKKAANGKGSSGWEKWQARVSKWSGWATEKGIKVEFEPWTATDLTEKLLREENASIVEHWFGSKTLNEGWFQRHIELATRVLDDRFNPDDHVEVSIEAVFDAMVRGPGITGRILEGFSAISNTRVPSIELSTIENSPDAKVIEAAEGAWNEVIAQRSSFSTDYSREWNFTPAKTSLGELIETVWSLERKCLSIENKSVKKENKRNFEVALNSLRDLSSSCYSLNEIFAERSLFAEAAQCAVIHGPAGAGKSHVFGRIAEQRIKNGLPTVLLLGQDFSDSDFWVQVGGQLGLERRTEEEVLGVLNAAGERKGVRTLLLFDAINEGVGVHYWRQRLPAFFGLLGRYPYLAAVLSCREEYLPYAIPDSLSDSLPKFRISGFSTSEEIERAAIQYLDNKGIARPNTPWLSPEFSNPLFLKSASEAIKSKGGTEFPRGLHGISELMALYLDALCWRTGASSTDPTQVSSSVKKLVQRFAGKMASEGCDFIEFDHATEIANACFDGMQPPSGKSWLQVLIETSLFRRDPPLFSDNIDPLSPPPDLVRFAFQRFQDHLMARSLVSSVRSGQVEAAFEENAPLNFLFFDRKPENGLSYQYAGLIGSLSTIYPEKLGVEFATTVPNWEEAWDSGHLLQEAFAESCKWRQTDAFSERTLEIFNRLEDGWADRLGLLLEVSMTTDHPWNALFLHSWLKKQSMPKRDSHWTRWVNWASREQSSQSERIVSWALSSLYKEADVRHLELASLVLVWSLSSSHMTLRDRATKALTTVFLKHSGIFEFLIEKVADCDDPYIIERFYAAAFGACCIEQKPERLNSYSRGIFGKVFAEGQPPVALLTRDYALGVLELAASRGALSSNVNLELCYPPYDSEAPVFDLTEAEVEQLADDRGGKEIFRSASSEWGDYGKYSIPGRVESFLSTPLSEPSPVSKKEIKRLFLDEVINPIPERVEALKVFEEFTNFSGETVVPILKDKMEEEEAWEQARAYKDARDASRKKLEDLLSPEEAGRLSKEYLRDGKGHGDYDSVNVQQCRLWITKRAYKLGWDAELFPNDGRSTSNFGYHNDMERIGKKYQRIALDEIQARLADNFWAVQGWPEEPCVYRYSHHDFRRNLEPTILPSDSRLSTPESRPDDWIVQPIIKLPEVREDDLKNWPFEQDPTEAMGEKLQRVDEQGKRWLVLYESNVDRRRYGMPKKWEHGIRYEEFRYFFCVFLKQGKARCFVDFLKKEQSLDVLSFRPREFTDGPYLLEAYWRDTWSSMKFSEFERKAPKGCEFAIPVANYHWESHLDKTLPEGFTSYLPQMWFANELELSISPEGPQSWIDDAGNCVVQTSRPFEHDTAMVIDEAKLRGYAEEFDVEPVWLMIAERNTWPRGSNNESCWRRSEGAVWLEDESWQQVGWNKDTKR